MRALLVLFSACCVFLGSEGYNWRAHEGHKFVSITPNTPEDVRYLAELQHSSGLDFWDDPSRVGRPVSILASPSQLTGLQMQLKTRQTLTIEVDEEYDITEVLREEWTRLSQKNSTYDYADFNEYPSFMAEIRNLADNFCPEGFVCTVTTIGTSIEGRDIDMLTIMNDPPSAQSVWMDSNIHAREWLASATMMNIFKKMLTEYDPAGGEANGLLKYNWYYVPIMNPDGHQHSWDEYRMWRKNRRVHADSTCTGTDLNRNYDFNWGQPGAGVTECSDTFRGYSAASEPETQAVQAQVTSVQDELIAFWSVHTHGEYMLAPWGNCTLPPDWEMISKVTNATCEAIAATGNLFWDCGNSCQVLYETSGTTSDWAYDKAGVRYSWTPELRGINGAFIPPPSEIPLSVAEIWNGVVTMMATIEQK